MSFIANFATRIARLEAQIQILQDKVTRSGIVQSEDLIRGKFLESGIDPTQSIESFESAKEASLTRISKQNMGFSDEELELEFETESFEWERFRGTYE